MKFCALLYLRLLLIIWRPYYIMMTKLVASDGLVTDNNFYSAAMSGNYMISGAYKDTEGASDQGSAYIYFLTGTTWAQQAKLVASDGAAGDWFGFSVAISGDYAIIGAYFGSTGNRGAAYIFYRTGTTWAQQATLYSGNPDNNGYFGFSVSIDGDYAG